MPAKQPQYLFPPSTLVLDSPRGSLVPLIQLLGQEEFVFVMYYAPWCSKSQSAKTEFAKAANFFQGEVKFAAVNCWWPEGECRKRYKFLMFPVLMAYHTTLDGYRYFGLVRAEQMIRFVENLLRPLTVVHSKMETIEMIAKHDTVVLGYFNLSSLNSIGAYRQFYYASMRILEKDHLQPTKFLVVTQSQVASAFNLSHFDDIVMMRINNKSMVYPFLHNVTSSNLIGWVLQHKGWDMVQRLSPEGLKSQALSTVINRGPAFIVFHVENPLFGTEHGLRVLKNIALLYRECMILPAFSGIRDVWTDVMKKEVRRHHLIVQMCEKSKLSLQPTSQAVSCCISTIIHSVNSSSKICSICQDQSDVCSLLPLHLLTALNRSRPISLNCRNVLLNYSWSEKLSVCCHLRNESILNDNEWTKSSLSGKWNISIGDSNDFYLKNSTVTYLQSRRSTDRYVRHYSEKLPRRLCDRLAVEKQQGLRSLWTPEIESEEEDADVKQKAQIFTNIGCTSNKSLNFYAMDSQNHWMFYDALGMKPFFTHGRPLAVLFDKVNEEHYIMKESFTLSNTMSFILDFEQGKLPRHKQSHSFEQTNCEEHGHICVKELSSDTFLSVVLEEDKDVVVLVYAHWCGFCQTASHTYLTLAQYFSTSQHITFARINGATNDLPWEYTFYSYPSILIFPARRKADSAAFAFGQEITLPNLIHFVLQHATIDTRLHLAADFCSSNCIRQNLRRSNSLLQALQNKQARLQVKLLELDAALNTEKDTEGGLSEASYDRSSVDFLRTKLAETFSKIDYVKKLIEYLKAHEDGIISKLELDQLQLWGRNISNV